MPRSNNNSIKLLLPPIIRLPPFITITNLRPPQRKDPLPIQILNSPLNSSIKLYETLIPLDGKKILNILPNNRVMPEGRILTMPLNRPLRANGRNSFLRERHGARVHVRF
jgi:hypothetical protein